jgi:hypothetical protein
VAARLGVEEVGGWRRGHLVSSRPPRVVEVLARRGDPPRAVADRACAVADRACAVADPIAPPGGYGEAWCGFKK